jgi:hypothetical protein
LQKTALDSQDARKEHKHLEVRGEHIQNYPGHSGSNDCGVEHHGVCMAMAAVGRFPDDYHDDTFRRVKCVREMLGCFKITVAEAGAKP